MTLKLARSGVEVQLYIQTVPCQVCGKSFLDPDFSMGNIDGKQVIVYSAVCSGCGTMREFMFRLPNKTISYNDEEPEFGGEQPSELLDPGDWMRFAHGLVGQAPKRPDGLNPEERQAALTDLRMAAAAVLEAIKFLPPGAESVPPSAFFSKRGRAFYAHDPDRFTRTNLAVARSTYRVMADYVSGREFS